MTGDQWFRLWLAVIQVLGSGLLTLIGGYFGFKLARRAEVSDRHVEQAARWLKRIVEVVDEVDRALLGPKKNATLLAQTRRSAQMKISDGIAEDPPIGQVSIGIGPRFISSASQLMAIEIGADLASLERDPDIALRSLKAHNTEYVRWIMRSKVSEPMETSSSSVEPLATIKRLNLMNDLPDNARQAIAAGLDLVRWEVELGDYNPTGDVLESPTESTL